eukprot:Pompholyxophrys_punicea_v1_NODE_135_length_3273_cov_11.162523.p5 type:complete len:119 gc:universal NODE_135_length_3273_cov_11.162523:2145-2501(+)
MARVFGMGSKMPEKKLLLSWTGFRDVLPYLKSLGMEVKMPCFMEKATKQQKRTGEKTSEKQLSLANANQSRLVAKTRWVVESYHGRLKKWRYFYNRQANSFIAKEHNLLQILSAARNA